jgi:hypothetical protein
VQILLSAYTGKRRKATGEIFPGGTKAVQQFGILRKWLDYKRFFGSSGRSQSKVFNGPGPSNRKHAIIYYQ